MSAVPEELIEDDIEDSLEEESEELVVEEGSSNELPHTDMQGLEDRAQQKRLIEALLFATPEAQSLRAIRNRLPEAADVGGILLELKEEYAERGINLVQMEDSWAFRTAPDLGAALTLNKKEEKKLSRAALETMSIIAYHQPVTRAEIENIRGVATSKGTLDVLMEAGWIKPGRRKDTPGRPLTWLTTTVFLDEFGIENLNDLPGLAELKAAGLLDTRPAIDTIPGGDLFSANQNEPSDEVDEDDDAEDDDAFDANEAVEGAEADDDDTTEEYAESDEDSDDEDSDDEDEEDDEEDDD